MDEYFKHNKLNGQIDLSSCIGYITLVNVKEEPINIVGNTVDLLFFEKNGRYDCLKLYSIEEEHPYAEDVSAVYGTYQFYFNIELPTEYSIFLNKEKTSLFFYSESGRDNSFPNGYGHINPNNFEERVVFKNHEFKLKRKDDFLIKKILNN